MVHIVGAGPGDPDLITVKGQRLLSEADVVIYAGSLVNEEILKFCKPEAEIYNSAQMMLEEILHVMTLAEKEGKTTVRLHTGDPSIYGAIQEQMDAMTARGIEFDVTPGVSSFLAAAAALKREYTLPGVTQTVIITRRGGRTPVPDTESLKKLAQHQTTLCIFLSVNLLDEIKRELMSAGFKSSTPVARKNHSGAARHHRPASQGGEHRPHCHDYRRALLGVEGARLSEVQPLRSEIQSHVQAGEILN